MSTVMDVYGLTSKETTEKYFRKFKLNYPKSIVRVVSHQFVSPDLERRRERII